MTESPPVAGHDPRRHHRRSVRLKGYDYDLPGAYFVTVCTRRHAEALGEAVDGRMVLSHLGVIADQCWSEIPAHFPLVELDEWIVMPNHVHGIVWIVDDIRPAVGAQHAAPLPDVVTPPGQPRVRPGSLGAIVRSYKAAVTRTINQMRGTPGGRVWQRGFYDHIIRTDRALERIRDYIAKNPALWDLDAENPSADGVDAGGYYRSIWRA